MSTCNEACVDLGKLTTCCNSHAAHVCDWPTCGEPFREFQFVPDVDVYSNSEKAFYFNDARDLQAAVKHVQFPEKCPAAPAAWISSGLREYLLSERGFGQVLLGVIASLNW